MSVSSSGAITTTGNVAGTASYASNAELLDGLDSTVFTLTSSFAAQTASFTAFTSSVNTFTASQLVLNGTYATTGSNTFAGIQTINSNLIVTGSITAQTLVVQTITSSVVYSSGSNVFGNNIANTQTFTGSVNITGSTNLVGALKVNKIGINTGNINLDNHSSNLIVSGTIAFANSSGGTAALVDRDGSGNTTFYGSSGDIKFTDLTMTSNYLTIKSAGNVGIGTADPSYRLHVSGAFSSSPGLYVYGTAYGMIGVDRGSSASSAGINYYTTGSQRWFTGIFENTNNFGFYNALSSNFPMVITTGNNVGIGTSSPLNVLDVRQASAIMGNYQTIQAFSTDSAAINLGGGISLGGYFTGTTSIAQFGSIVGRKENGTSGNYDGYLAFGTNAQATGVVERMRITSAGNVGIGTGTPTDLLTLYRNANQDNTLSIYQGTGGYASTLKLVGANDDGARYNNIGSYTNGGNPHWLIGGGSVANTMIFYTNNNTERMRITSAGRVGINDTTPTMLLSLGGSTGRKVHVYNDGGGANDVGGGLGVDLGGFSAETSIFFGNWAGSGRFTIGAWTSSQTYSTKLTILANGSIGAPSGTNIYNPSDLRLKKNITTITNGLDKVSALNPVKFNWIDGFDSSEDGKDMLGFIAQEVESIIPEAVEGFSNGSAIIAGETTVENPLRVNEKFIIPVLVKAIQELKAENDTLKEILQRNNIQ
jgi:hypothetical protein